MLGIYKILIYLQIFKESDAEMGMNTIHTRKWKKYNSFNILISLVKMKIVAILIDLKNIYWAPYG